MIAKMPPSKTQYILNVVQCWAGVTDGGQTLKQHWVNISCLLGNNACGKSGDVWNLGIQNDICEDNGK